LPTTLRRFKPIDIYHHIDYNYHVELMRRERGYGMMNQRQARRLLKRLEAKKEHYGLKIVIMSHGGHLITGHLVKDGSLKMWTKEK
jgi:hypothetical protein